MRPIILFLFLSLAFSSCKSIKKVKQTETVSMMRAANATKIDSAVFMTAEAIQSVEEEEVTETIEQTFIPMDSAGLTIFKPVTIQKKKSRVIRTSDSTKSEQDISLESVRENSVEEELKDFKDLDKSSEGQDPIESITTAIFPTWGKIIAAILTAVVPALWAWWQKRKQT